MKKRTRCQEGFRRLALVVGVVAAVAAATFSIEEWSSLATRARQAEAYAKSSKIAKGSPIKDATGEAIGYAASVDITDVHPILSDPEFLEFAVGDRMKIAARVGLIKFDPEGHPMGGDGKRILPAEPPTWDEYLMPFILAIAISAMAWAVVRSIGWLVSGFIDGAQLNES